MKLSENWLRERVDLKLSSAELVNQLTNLGLEVDSITPVAEAFSGVVVGKILAATPHPNADRLRCCQVDVGGEQPLNIVCGGVNARAGITVAVARVGAVLAGNFKIKETTIRGEASSGMICSSSELGMDDDLSPEGGIMELIDDVEVGVDFWEYFDLNDNMIDIELTPNRGDCASVIGIARELAVLNNESVNMPFFDVVKVVGKLVPPIKHTAVEACPRYVARLITDIDTTAVTPVWLSECLRRGGIRCISPVVDVMNYVMLELGQPLHAFDYDCIEGELEVRLAQSGEAIELLDGQQLPLDKQSLVIADRVGPLALAGIMGGARSAVSEGTSHILLESAFFEPIALRRTASKYNLKTDSSYRFERGVDYSLQRQAIERASALLNDIVGGSPGVVIDLIDQSNLPEPKTVTLRVEQIHRVLGIEVPSADVVDILVKLGFVLLNEETPWHFRVPAYRFDIEREIDLIEEIARVYGYANIPSAKVMNDGGVLAVPETQLLPQRLSQTLVSRGYSESITYSFVSPRSQAYFLEEGILPIDIKNPIASDLSQMRVSVWPSLLSVMQYNLNRQQNRVRVFEFGRVFGKCQDQLQQPLKLAMLAVGQDQPVSWRGSHESVDFFSMKADVEMLLALTHRLDAFDWEPCRHPALHPGQSAALKFQGERIGLLGVLHPKAVLDLGLGAAPVLFEVDCEAILTSLIPVFSPIAKFPSVRRDIAIVVGEEVLAADICQYISEIGGELINNVEIFDIYQGEGIKIGKKSVALGLTFFDPSRTLIDSEVDITLEEVIQGLRNRFKATMRA